MNSIGFTPMDDSVLLALVHGPVRDLLAVILKPSVNAPRSIGDKLFDLRNRVWWLYAEPHCSHYAVPPSYNVARPLVLWCWALEEHRNEADVCIKLLEHIDCLNNPERVFYRDIAVDLLKSTSKDQLEKIYRRLCAVADSAYNAAGSMFTPDWSKGYEND